MRILGIETSCDETSVAVIENGKTILSNIISTQIDVHKEYGGVVPEIASRHHVNNILPVMEEALQEANLKLSDMDYIAVTYAPGLIGALLVGIAFAKSLSYATKIPLIPVHHLRGHVYSNFLEHDIKLPAVCLIVSGGHTNIVYIDENHNFENMGSTLDDAVGESYDKVARVLGLGYPGGPVVDRLAKLGNPEIIKFKEPNVDGYDFSFSGIKTGVINFVNKARMKEEEFKNEDLLASFQETVVNLLVKKTIKAAKEKNVKTIIMAGGVAANSRLREMMKEKAKGMDVYYPSLKLCTDNGAMIAAAAYYKLKYSKGDNIFAGLDLNGKANLSIEKD